MLKLVGCLLVVAVGGLVGFAKSGKYKARVEQLSLCRTFFLRLSARAKGTGESTRALIQYLSDTQSLEKLTFLKTAGDRLNVETDFPVIWKECLDEAKSVLALREDDYRPLYSLCEVMGSTDLEGIVANATLSAQLYEQTEAAARKEYETNGKLFRSLGLLCGVAVAVLLI